MQAQEVERWIRPYEAAAQVLADSVEGNSEIITLLDDDLGTSDFGRHYEGAGGRALDSTV